MPPFSDAYALLSAQRALSGSVTSELRALDIKYLSNDDSLYLRIYYDGEAQENEIDLWECVIAEASVNFDSLDADIIRLDFPQKIPHYGRYAYLRKEPIPSTTASPFQGPLPIQRKFVRFENTLGQFMSPTDESTFDTCWGIEHLCEGSEIIPAKPEIYPIPTMMPVAYAQLALQRALLGTVVPELAVVLVDVQDALLYIRIYYEGLIEKTTWKDWELVMTKTWADFGSGYVLDGKIQSIVYPNPIPVRGRYAYRRREPHDRGPWPSNKLSYV